MVSVMVLLKSILGLAVCVTDGASIWLRQNVLILNVSEKALARGKCLHAMRAHVCGARRPLAEEGTLPLQQRVAVGGKA